MPYIEMTSLMQMPTFIDYNTPLLKGQVFMNPNGKWSRALHRSDNTARIESWHFSSAFLIFVPTD